MARPATAVLLAVALAMGPGGCKSAGDATGDRAKPQAARAGKPRPELAPPPGLEASLVARPAGPAAGMAEMTLDEVRAITPAPDYLTQSPSATPLQPSLEAQRLYFDGRSAWREGRNFDAIKALQAALREQGDGNESPEVLRLLGRIYASIGNRVRGADYLRQAVRADPADVRSLLDLGRQSLEASNWGEAVAIFGAAGDRLDAAPERDHAARRLTRYYLATALMQAGHAAAAAAEFEAFLAGAEGGAQTSALSREVEILDAQAGTTWQTLGDLRHRLGQPEAALEAYVKAAEAGVLDGTGLARRLVYSYLRLGRDEEAQALVVRRVGGSGADGPTLQLVRYLGENGAGGTMLAARLREVYEREGRPTSLVLALSDVLPERDAAALLRDHLSAKPGDLRVYEHLLSRFLMESGIGSADDEAVREALAVTESQMAAAPTQATEVVSIFMRVAVDREAVLQRMPNDGASPQRRVIRATALAATGKADDAEAEFRAALDADPASLVARLQLTKLMVLRDRYDEAAELLEPLAASTDPGVIGLRVLVLSRTGKSAEAVALLDEAMRAGPVDVSLILQKAQLQLSRGDATGAERTLLDALNVRPEDERIYEALLELYDPGGGDSPIPDSMKSWQRLVRRLLGTIPESRVGRLVRAEIHEARGEAPQAEELLKGLLAENEADSAALAKLLELYLSGNRREEAVKLLESRVAENLRDQKLLLQVALAYKKLGEHGKMLDTVERYLQTRPESEDRQIALATVALERGDAEEARRLAEGVLASPRLVDPSDALEVLADALGELGRLDDAERRYLAAIDRFPEKAADLSYQRASLLLEHGEEARAVELFEANLRRFPDHGITLNALGYHLVVKGKDLERARAMIQKAVDGEPQVAAYLDSLGWAEYMLGRYDEAVTWLEKASQAPGGGNPVIVDHLGDALWRVGRKNDAVQRWGTAKAMVERLLPREFERNGDQMFQAGRVSEAVRFWSQSRKMDAGEMPFEDAEMKDLPARLDAKLRAARRNQAPPVTRLPGEPAAPPDAPAAGEGEAIEPAAEAPPIGDPEALEQPAEEPVMVAPAE